MQAIGEEAVPVHLWRALGGSWRCWLCSAVTTAPHAGRCGGRSEARLTKYVNRIRDRTAPRFCGCGQKVAE